MLLNASLNGSRFAQKAIGSNTIYPKGTIRECTRHGINYRLDISDYMDHVIYFGFDNLTDFERNSLYTLVKPGQVIFDVGGYIGDTALHFARLQNNNGKIYCFEPVPYLFDRLTHNVGLNTFKNISIYNLAISDTASELYFNVSRSQNSSGIFLSDKGSGQSRKVVAIKLDDFCSEKNIDRIDLIKIDVEGFELKVLKGAEEILRKFRPKMFIEIDEVHLKRAGASAKEVVKMLLDLNYKISRADTQETIGMDYNFEGKHFDIVCV